MPTSPEEASQSDLTNVACICDAKYINLWTIPTAKVTKKMQKQYQTFKKAATDVFNPAFINMTLLHLLQQVLFTNLLMQHYRWHIGMQLT